MKGENLSLKKNHQLLLGFSVTVSPQYGWVRGETTALGKQRASPSLAFRIDVVMVNSHC